MEYRNIGRTGMSASVVGLGAEHLDRRPYPEVEETVREAMEQGINIMDLFMPGEEVRRNIGRAIAGRRDRIMIQGHFGSTMKDGQYDIDRDLEKCRQSFEDLLRCLDTDYIDFGMLFFVDSDEAFDQVFGTPLIDYVREQKRKGAVRAIGASSHNPHVARRVVETGEIDLLMFSINPVFDMMPADADIMKMVEDELFSSRKAGDMDPARAELYRVCERREVGITVMKSLGAGKLLTADQSPFGQPLTPGQCIHYALTRPAVVSALVGCKNASEVREAARYCEMTDAERDYSPIVRRLKGDFGRVCMYCNHCLPCPSGIDVAAVHRCLDTALLDERNIPESVAGRYDNLSAHASDCIGCGSCERRCPFSVPVIRDMRKAAEVFGK